MDRISPVAVGRKALADTTSNIYTFTCKADKEVLTWIT